MRKARTLPCLCLTIAALALALPVQAQDVATADALFNKGLADMQAGKYDTGCPALKESQRIDPSPGTLFTLAECEAKAGLYATAVTRYDDYLQVFSRLPPAEQKLQLGREKVAASQKQALAPLVPTLTITLAPTAPKGTRVLRDDVELSALSMGLALPIDPGEHTLSIIAPGRKETEKKISVNKGDKITLELDAPPAEPPPPPPDPKPTAEPKSTTDKKDPIVKEKAPLQVTPKPAASKGRPIAYVAGGVGIAASLVGAVTGAMVFDKKGTIDAKCKGIDCSKEGLDAAESAQTLATASNVAFGIGLAGLATGVVMWFVSSPPEKKKEAEKPNVAWVMDVAPLGATGVMVQLGGEW